MIAIYLSGDHLSDSAILQGLTESDCEVLHTSNTTEAIEQVMRHAKACVVIIDDQNTRGLSFLTLIHERQIELPPIMILDRVGVDARKAVRTLQLGATDYLFFDESEATRSLRASLLVERARLKANHSEAIQSAPVNQTETHSTAPATTNDIKWDGISHLIEVCGARVKLSPIEGRIFNTLYTAHRQAISNDELIKKGLLKNDIATERGIKLLRPHVVRLRIKLDNHPKLAHRIVNVRGEGYMFV